LANLSWSGCAPLPAGITSKDAKHLRAINGEAHDAPRENEVERQEVGTDAATDDAGFGEEELF